jgi:hypothetical protein
MLHAFASIRTVRSTPGRAPRSPCTPRLNKVSVPSGASSKSWSTSCESSAAGVQARFANGDPLSSLYSRYLDYWEQEGLEPVDLTRFDEVKVA